MVVAVADQPLIRNMAEQHKSETAQTSSGPRSPRGESSRKLPLLDNVRVGTPCHESWDGMVGDERVRFCGGCMKNVYNLSAMSKREAEELIAAKEGDLCVRLYRRKDGTIISGDCPVGVRRQRVTKIAAAALAFGGAGLAMALAPTPDTGAAHTERVETVEEVEPCDAPVRSNSGRPTRTGLWLYNWLGESEPAAPPQPVEPPPEPHEVMMGDMVMEPPPPARMGKIKITPNGTHKNDKVPTI